MKKTYTRDTRDTRDNRDSRDNRNNRDNKFDKSKSGTENKRSERGYKGDKSKTAGGYKGNPRFDKSEGIRDTRDVNEGHLDNLREDIIEGRNPVMEALKSDREIDKIFIQKGERHGSIIKVISIAKEKRIVIIEAERQKLDTMSVTGAHQGVIAFAATQKYVSVEEIITAAKNKGEKPFIIIVDEVTDPHNLGAIIRTADAVGAHGVIIPQRRSVGLSAVVAKASAGAVEYVPVAKAVNLARTIDELKQKGIWIAGADISGEKTYYETDLSGAIGLVIGSEGTGISRLIKEKCDFLVNIPMKGKISSLNASVAGAILMYEILRQRTV